MFPQRLDSSIAYDIAKAMMDGFNRHYQLFRTESARAKHRFETADWHGQQRAQRERIEFYDLRVREASTRLESEFKAGEQPMDVWQQVKLHYIGLLVNHHQPELAETFFNSVTTKILHRSYFQNDFIFVRPAISTEYIENDEPASQPTYRAYYPTRDNMREMLLQVVATSSCACRSTTSSATRATCSRPSASDLGDVKLRANFQIQVLPSLFFRNKGAYVVGKIINGFNESALRAAHPAQQGRQAGHRCRAVRRGRFADAVQLRARLLHGRHGHPSAYVQFLRSMMPHMPRAEIYNALGLAKQGKTLFYRDFLYHLRHSTDKFRIAPGIKGMVMLVFDLPSFPTSSRSSRTSTRRRKTPRASRSRASTCWSSSTTAWAAWPTPRSTARSPSRATASSDELIAEIEKFAPSQLEISDRDGDGQTEVIIKHLYIERRMIPLNIYLQEAFDAGVAEPGAKDQIERAVVEYGNAIKDLVAANIFPGDMLWKNFGVTRHGKVVFYDYDEIEYLTDCNFRKVPEARNEEDEM